VDGSGVCWHAWAFALTRDQRCRDRVPRRNAGITPWPATGLASHRLSSGRPQAPREWADRLLKTWHEGQSRLNYKNNALKAYFASNRRRKLASKTDADKGDLDDSWALEHGSQNDLWHECARSTPSAENDAGYWWRNIGGWFKRK